MDYAIRMTRMLAATFLLASPAAGQTPITNTPDSSDTAPVIESVNIGTEVWMREN